MLASGGVLLLRAGNRSLAAWLGVLVGLIGFTALVQYIAGVEFRALNTLLMFGREWGRVGVTSPGRMGPPGSFSWIFIGIALLLSARGGFRGRRLAPRLALVTLGISGLSIAGYLFGADRLYSAPYLTVIAFQTATFLAALSIAIIASVPEHPPAKWLLDRGATGDVSRRAVPMIIVIPVVVGWLRLLGERRGLYDTPFGVAALVVTLIILLLVLLFWMLRIVRKHENSLKAGEQRIASTLESIADGYYVLDQKWRYAFVNAEGARLVGRTPADLLGRIVWEEFPEMVGSTAYRELHRAARDRVTVEYESHNPERDAWFSVRAYPSADGSIGAHFRDITERKLIEASRETEASRLTKLHDLSTRLVQGGELIVLLQDALAAAVELTGAIRGNMQLVDPDSRQLRILVHHGHGADFLRQYEPHGSFVGCELAAQQKARLIIPDITAEPSWQGTVDLDVLLNDGIRGFQSTPLITRDGRLLGVLNTHFDTPRQPSESELRHLDVLARILADFIERSQSEEALRNADRMKDEFLAMLAHELRNPLAPIQNAVHLLRTATQGDDRLREATDLLDRQVVQMVRLVNDLVDVSRVTRGKIELLKQPVDVSTAVRQAVETVEPVITSKRQELDIVVPVEPGIVDADFTRLVQVVGNLLSNASKYSPVGGRIDLTVTRDDQGAISIHVRDNGLGMTEAQLPRIFDLFMQVDSSLERSAGGLGIGLTLAKTLVEMHGGTITARSEGRGKGSEFIVQLPGSAGSGEAARATRADGSNGDARPRRILIVDDNEDGAVSLASVLSMSGHFTYTAHDGEQAVTMAEQYRPDVVLLDIGLPKLNGFEACRRIREQPWGREMLVVAVTGWGADTYRQRSTEAGFDTHVVKPVDSAMLIRLLNER